jgi:hypothetical protein
MKSNPLPTIRLRVSRVTFHKPLDMADIQTSLQSLANTFVQGVLKTLSTASLNELSALTSGAEGGRRGRAAATVAAAVEGPRKGGRAAAAKGSRGRAAAGRRIRRSSDDVVALAEKVSEFVRGAGGDVAVSDIAKALDVDTADITRPVAIALQAGKIQKRGEKRLTRYFPGDGQRPSRGRKR